MSQRQIKEVLKVQRSPIGVNDIASSTGLSVGYIRTQLAALEAAGVVERVDNRTPILYRLSPNSPEARYEREIAKVKEGLLSPVKAGDNFLYTYLKRIPKSQWKELIEPLAVYSAAIKALEDEGKLIDTL